MQSHSLSCVTSHCDARIAKLVESEKQPFGKAPEHMVYKFPEKSHKLAWMMWKDEKRAAEPVMYKKTEEMSTLNYPTEQPRYPQGRSHAEESVNGSYLRESISSCINNDFDKPNISWKLRERGQMMYLIWRVPAVSISVESIS